MPRTANHLPITPTRATRYFVAFENHAERNNAFVTNRIIKFPLHIISRARDPRNMNIFNVYKELYAKHVRDIFFRLEKRRFLFYKFLYISQIYKMHWNRKNSCDIEMVRIMRTKFVRIMHEINRMYFIQLKQRMGIYY